MNVFLPGFGTFVAACAAPENVSKVYSIDIGYPIPKEVSIKNVNKFKHPNCFYKSEVIILALL